jgi:hypothetical protein
MSKTQVGQSSETQKTERKVGVSHTAAKPLRIGTYHCKRRLLEQKKMRQVNAWLKRYRAEQFPELWLTSRNYLVRKGGAL